MAYLLARNLHLATVALSLSLFAFRGILMMAGSRWLESRMLRITPHLVDTILLVSALWLTTLIHQYPFRDAWLTAKVAGLVAYIVLGSIALRRGRTRRVRVAAFIAALCTVAWIVSVALTRHPAGVFAGI
jgi:uncharacterized membrane protein SirB2